MLGDAETKQKLYETDVLPVVRVLRGLARTGSIGSYQHVSAHRLGFGRITTAAVALQRFFLQRVVAPTPVPWQETFCVPRSFPVDSLGPSASFPRSLAKENPLPVA